LRIENAKDTLCRNVTIYGKCRYEDKGTHLAIRGTGYGKSIDVVGVGCAFNHTIEKPALDGGQPDRYIQTTPKLLWMGCCWLTRSSIQSKKTLNVDSPSFTPSFLSPNGAATATPAGKKSPAGISPKAASAAPFMPKAIISREFRAADISNCGEIVPYSSCQDLQMQLRSVKMRGLQTGLWVMSRSSFLEECKNLQWYVPQLHTTFLC
jgi:hypothetical protein